VKIRRRSPKNISIARGLYDGPGGFDETGASIEAHLAKIESAAAPAIRKFAAAELGRSEPASGNMSLARWYAIMRKKRFTNLVQLRKTFPTQIKLGNSPSSMSAATEFD
jgi:hypothetical protein